MQSNSHIYSQIKWKKFLVEIINKFKKREKLFSNKRRIKSTDWLYLNLYYLI